MSVDPLVANGRVTFQTAEEQACAQVPVFSPMHRAEHVRQALVGHRYDSVSLSSCVRGISSWES
jgi:hypothetical protein